MEQKLRDSLANGETKQVITELLTLTMHNSDLYNQVIPLSARYTHYEKQKLGGVEDSSVLNIELRQINVALLALINELYDKTSPLIPKPEKNPTKDKFKWLKILVAVIAVVIVANLPKKFQWLEREPSPPSKNEPFSVVVYTHGQSGKQDIAIMKETRLVADFGGRREVAKVGENGQNTFNEIPSEFRNKRIGIGLQGQEGYILTYKDSTYLLDGNPIYLSVKKKNKEKPTDTGEKGREKELQAPSVEESPKVEYRTYKTCVLDYLDNKLKDITVKCSSCDSVLVSEDGEITLKINKGKKIETTPINIYRNGKHIWSCGINWDQEQKCIKTEK